MKKQMNDSYCRLSERVERVRRIYSRIGEPLPVEIIIDLYRHLGKISLPGGKQYGQPKRRTEA